MSYETRSPLNLYSLFEEKMKPEFWQSWQSCTCIWNILVSHYLHRNQHLWDQVSKKIKSYRKIVAENYQKWKLKAFDTHCSVMTIKISNLGNQYVGCHKRSIHNSGIHKRSSITKALYNKTHSFLLTKLEYTHFELFWTIACCIRFAAENIE